MNQTTIGKLAAHIADDECLRGIEHPKLLVQDVNRDNNCHWGEYTLRYEPESNIIVVHRAFETPPDTLRQEESR